VGVLNLIFQAMVRGNCCMLEVLLIHPCEKHVPYNVIDEFISNVSQKDNLGSFEVTFDSPISVSYHLELLVVLLP
jgi:hypothetical protein